jgi:ParB/RepB/Spo0J family partition protein
VKKMKVHEMEIERLFVGEANVRKELGDISELVKSVRQIGIVEPLVVRPAGDKYEVVAGRRRYEAARRAGLGKVPCVIREMGDEEAVLVSLAENVQRGEITEEEIGRAYEALRRANPKLTQTAIARRIGKGQQWLSRIVGAYEAYKMLRDAGLVSGMKANPTRREREGGIAPITHLAEIGYAIESAKGRLPKDELDKKLIELARAALPLPIKEAKKLIKRFRERPEGPLKGEEGAARPMGSEPAAREGRVIAKPLELQLTTISSPVRIDPVVLLYFDYARRRGYDIDDLGQFISDCVKGYFRDRGIRIMITREAV